MSTRTRHVSDDAAPSFKLSDDKTVELRELNGWSTTLAERLAAAILGNVSPEEMTSGYPIVVGKVYAIGSISKINGLAVDPLANMQEYVRVANMLTFAETNALMAVFMERMGAPVGQDLKKS